MAKKKQTKIPAIIAKMQASEKKHAKKKKK